MWNKIFIKFLDTFYSYNFYNDYSNFSKLLKFFFVFNYESPIYLFSILLLLFYAIPDLKHNVPKLHK